MNNKVILVFVSGKLLSSYEYYLAGGCIEFKSSLNFSTRSTYTNVIIVKEGSKIYDEIIFLQNISEIDLLSGEVR